MSRPFYWAALRAVGGLLVAGLFIYDFEGFRYCGVVGIAYFVIAFCTPYLSGYQSFDPMLKDLFVFGGDLPEVDGIFFGIGCQCIPKVFVVVKTGYKICRAFKSLKGGYVLDIPGINKPAQRAVQVEGGNAF